MKLPVLYSGSVKNILGPIRIPHHQNESKSHESLLFEYSDAYSVFDWGRMPDTIDGKGKALAILGAFVFEKLENPATWQKFFKSPSFEVLVNLSPIPKDLFCQHFAWLEQLGLNTHYLGVISEDSEKTEVGKLSERGSKVFNKIAVKKVNVVKPKIVDCLGKSIYHYSEFLDSPLPKLLPLEVVFRFGCPKGSSFTERAKDYPELFRHDSTTDLNKVKWNFPIVELFSKLETTDRLLGFSEALAISGLSSSQFNDLLLKTVWVAALLKSLSDSAGLELADGKLEWALDQNSELMLVDSVGPDELRILKNGYSLSKEFLREYYRKTKWFESLCGAKEQAKKQGHTRWKELVMEIPPKLPDEYLILTSQLYRSLTNALTQETWFANAWELDKVVKTFEALESAI